MFKDSKNIKYLFSPDFKLLWALIFIFYSIMLSIYQFPVVDEFFKFNIRWFSVYGFVPYNGLPGLILVFLAIYLIFLNIYYKRYNNFFLFSVGLLGFGLFYLYSAYLDYLVLLDQVGDVVKTRVLFGKQNYCNELNKCPIEYQDSHWGKAYSLNFSIIMVAVTALFMHFEHLYRRRISAIGLYMLTFLLLPASILFLYFRSKIFLGGEGNISENWEFSTWIGSGFNFVWITFILYFIGIFYFCVFSILRILQAKNLFLDKELKRSLNIQLALFIGGLQGILSFSIFQPIRVLTGKTINIHAPFIAFLFFIPLSWMYIRNSTYISFLGVPVYEIVVLDEKDSKVAFYESFREGKMLESETDMKTIIIKTIQDLFKEITGSQKSIISEIDLGDKVLIIERVETENNRYLVILISNKTTQFLKKLLQLYVSDLKSKPAVNSEEIEKISRNYFN